MVSFGQPWGFLALLGVPLVLAIHFLQRETRRVVVSTLFLLEHLAPESLSGRRLERLRTSVPLWMQLLAVLVLTWLLVEPRWPGRAVPHFTLVLDSSVSMQAFRPELRARLPGALSRLQGSAWAAEWTLLETDVSRPPLYVGRDARTLQQALTGWEPQLGTHDFSSALEAARAESTGRVVLITDRPVPVPEGVTLLALGRPLENCGFAGVTVEGRRWRALVKNYGRAPQQRTWSTGGGSPATLTLAPGQTVTLAGDFPSDTARLEVALTPDDFPLDDRLPLVLPSPKPLAVEQRSAGDFADFATQLTATLAAAVAPAPQADVSLAAYDPLSPKLPTGTAIVFVSDPAQQGKLLGGEVVAQTHPLTEGLNWAGLICRNTLRIPAQPEDVPLVWQGERPLLVLRPRPTGDLLLVNFDLRASNARQLPALVLCLHRFLEGVRAAKVGPETANVEAGQRLSIAGAAPRRAPANPGFFTVEEASRPLLTGAAHFADAREADFRDAATQDELAALAKRLEEERREPDTAGAWWLLAVGAAMVVSWGWRGRRAA